MPTNQHAKPNPKTGFDIGWDYFAHDLILPVNLRENKDVMDGYVEARKRKVPIVEHDRYIRKWLLLRANAWRRNRLVDEAVTPDFLNSIDTEYCPVTRQRLEHGSETENDWSIDRVNNDAGYAIGNLVVVSALANISKGTYTLGDMFTFAYVDDIELPPVPSENSRPLTRIEWARWALISSHTGSRIDVDGEKWFTFAPTPCVIRPPKGIPISVPSEIQIMIAAKDYSSIESKVYKDFSMRLPKPKRRVLHNLSRMVDKNAHTRQFPLDVWFNLRIFFQFVDFYDSLTNEEASQVIQCRCRTGKNLQSFKSSAMGHENKGFVSN